MDDEVCGLKRMLWADRRPPPFSDRMPDGADVGSTTASDIQRSVDLLYPTATNCNL